MLGEINFYKKDFGDIVLSEKFGFIWIIYLKSVWKLGYFINFMGIIEFFNGLILGNEVIVGRYE